MISTPSPLLLLAEPQFCFGGPCIQPRQTPPVLAMHIFLANETLLGILGSLLLFPVRGINVSPSPLSLPLFLERDRTFIATRAIVQL